MFIPELLIFPPKLNIGFIHWVPHVRTLGVVLDSFVTLHPPFCQRILFDSYLENKKIRLLSFFLVTTLVCLLPGLLKWASSLTSLHVALLQVFSPTARMSLNKSQLMFFLLHGFLQYLKCHSSHIMMLEERPKSLSLACKVWQDPAPLYLSELISDHSPSSSCHSSPSGLLCLESAWLTPASGHLHLLFTMLQWSPFVGPHGNPL